MRVWPRALVFAVGPVSALVVPMVGSAESPACRQPDARVIAEAVVVDDELVTFVVVSITYTDDDTYWLGWIVPGERLDVGYPSGDGDLLEVGSRYLVEVSGYPPAESSVLDRPGECSETRRPDGSEVDPPPMPVIDRVLRWVPAVVGAALVGWAAVRWRGRRALRRRSERAGASLAAGEVVPLPGLAASGVPANGDGP